MALQEPNNEQKLSFIYNTLKDQEIRRVRAIWYKFSKWTIYLGLIYLAVTNSALIIGKLTEVIQPIVMDQMKTLLEKNKDALMESVKGLLPSETIPVESIPPQAKKTPTKF